MKHLKDNGCHDCCPKDWKQTPDMTGSFELDAVIVKSKNKDMGDRLENHLVADTAYKLNTGYGRGSIG